MRITICRETGIDRDLVRFYCVKEGLNISLTATSHANDKDIYKMKCL